MQAAQFLTPGEPSAVLKCVQIPAPTPGPGEVLVRMTLAPVNPSDLMYIRGQYTVPATCPAVAGFEGVGVVEKSGGGLRGRIFTGKRVIVLNKKGGNWADYAVVPADQVIPVSSGLSDEQAATFFVNPATAWVMTQEVLRIRPGAWLLQTAAASSLGRMVVRLGKTCDFRTLCVVRRESQAESLRQLGASHVLVFDGSPEREAQFLEQVARVTGPGGVRYAIDSVGGTTGSAVVRSLGQGGHLLAFGTLSGQPLTFSPRQLMTTGSRVEGFWLGNFMSSCGLMFKLRLIRRLTGLIRSGVLESAVKDVLPVAEIQKAVQLAEQTSGVQDAGKVLIRMNAAQS